MTELASFGSWAVTAKGVEHKHHRAIVPLWAIYTKAIPELAAYMQRGLAWIDNNELFTLRLAIQGARQLFDEKECRETLKGYKS